MHARSIHYGGTGDLSVRLQKTLGKFILFTGACALLSKTPTQAPASFSYYEYPASILDIAALGKQYAETPGATIINKSPTGGSNCITISSLGKVILGASSLSATTISLRYIRNKHQRAPKDERGVIVYGDLQVGHGSGLASPSCLRGLKVPIVPVTDIFTRLLRNTALISTERLPTRDDTLPLSSKVIVNGVDTHFNDLSCPWKESFVQLQKSMGDAFPKAITNYYMRVYDCIMSPKDACDWILAISPSCTSENTTNELTEPSIKSKSTPGILKQPRTPTLAVLFRMAAKMPHKLLASPQTGRCFQDSLLFVAIHGNSYEASFYEY
ncbi:hypothetical protein QR46_4268 [Giardia duodenalis assemblage B]|uniref:Uncharacterized protein n=1 Tax=Giardia duodenalis assemblage B TaxID=1394984 RepID=A0A132NPR9_GIAIN|nr:hypothetical protein QR46_4268 [Giardia intestinalis assemblage B]